MADTPEDFKVLREMQTSWRANAKKVLEMRKEKSLSRGNKIERFLKNYNQKYIRTNR